MTAREEIAALRAEVAELRAEVAALRAQGSVHHHHYPPQPTPLPATAPIPGVLPPWSPNICRVGTPNTGGSLVHS
jgi:hypothetical protein